MKPRWILLVVCVGCLIGGGSNAIAQSSGQSEKASLEVLLEKAKGLVEQQRFPEVITLLEREVTKYPRASEVRYYLGLAYYETGNYEKALRWASEAEKLSPNDGDAIYLSGACYLGVGELALALQKAQQAASLSPDDPEIQLLLGIASVFNGNGAAAIPVLEKLMKVRKSPTVFYALAVAYRMGGRESEAQQALREAWRVENQSHPLSPQRQQVLRRLQQHESPHCAVLLPPLPDAEVERILSRLEEVYRQVAEMLQCQPESKVEVAVYPDETTFRRLHPNSAIAVETDGRRLIMPPAWVTNEDSRGILIAGMLGSLVVQISDGRAPYWLTKGLSLLAGQRVTLIANKTQEQRVDTGYALALALKYGKNVPLAVLELFPYDKMYGVHTVSYFATRYLIETYGYEKLGKFLQVLGKGKAVEAALKETMGIDYAALTKGWQELARKELQKHERAVP